MTSFRTGRQTENLGGKRTDYELDNYGIKEASKVYWNLNTCSEQFYDRHARDRARRFNETSKSMRQGCQKHCAQ